MYVPERGRVLVDSHDLSLADPAWLRRQIGVVLQENFLFNRSVRENIAMADPGIPLERVIHAATLAGAHTFISELPEGYDTRDWRTRLQESPRRPTANASPLPAP